jgi:hypothetical protein
MMATLGSVSDDIGILAYEQGQDNRRHLAG